jgi:hypothetical protein
MLIFSWLKRHLLNRIVGSILQCVTWAGLSIHEWRDQPNGLYFWLTLMLVVASVFILRSDIITHVRKSSTGSNSS